MDHDTLSANREVSLFELFLVIVRRRTLFLVFALIAFLSGILVLLFFPFNRLVPISEASVFESQIQIQQVSIPAKLELLYKAKTPDFHLSRPSFLALAWQGESTINSLQYVEQEVLDLDNGGKSALLTTELIGYDQEKDSTEKQLPALRNIIRLRLKGTDKEKHQEVTRRLSSLLSQEAANTERKVLEKLAATIDSVIDKEVGEAAVDLQIQRALIEQLLADPLFPWTVDISGPFELTGTKSVVNRFSAALLVFFGVIFVGIILCYIVDGIVRIRNNPEVMSRLKDARQRKLEVKG